MRPRPLTKLRKSLGRGLKLQLRRESPGRGLRLQFQVRLELLGDLKLQLRRESLVLVAAVPVAAVRERFRDKLKKRFRERFRVKFRELPELQA